MNIGRKISATIGITLMWAISAVNITIGELLVARSWTYKYQIWRDWTDYKYFLKSTWIREETPDCEHRPNGKH